MTPKFPDIKVELTGQEAMSKAGRSDKEVKEFCDEAMSDDYDHLIQTCMKWVDVI